MARVASGVAAAAAVDDHARTVLHMKAVEASDAKPADETVQSLAQDGRAPAPAVDAPSAATAQHSATPAAAAGTAAPTPGNGAGAAAPAAPRQRPPSAAIAPAVSGEVSGGKRVALKQSSEVPTADKPAPKPAAGGQGSRRGGFRETMWFFKGEVESAMAEQGEGEALAEAEEAADLAQKYADDGSLTEAEARRLSLRTGRTQMMQAVKVPDGKLPGDRMRAEDFIHEMHRGKRIAIYVGIAAVLAITAALVLYFVTG